MPTEHQRGNPETIPIPLVQFALSYARSGWPVFPLIGKIPLKDTNGHKDATTDPQKILALWTQHPTANIGLATGERAKVIVLDIDPPEGYYHLKELQQTRELLPETRRVSTAHKGLHYYFLYPIDGETYTNSVGLAGREGVDIRANGGYVVLPPSRLYNRLSYTWANEETPIAPLPAWLGDIIRQERHKQESIPQGGRFASTPGEKWLSLALQKVREGNRNAIGFWLACQLRDDKIPEAEARSVILTYANLAPSGKEQYTSKEAIASVRSAYKRPPREPARRQ
jgi:hypothetical protein